MSVKNRKIVRRVVELVSGWKKEFIWLDRDLQCSKAVDILVAHSGYAESQEHIKCMLREANIIDVERVFAKLVEKKVIILEKPGSLFGWTVPIVTEEGSPYRRRY